MNNETKKQLEHRINQTISDLDSVYFIINDSELLMMKRKLQDLKKRHI